MSLATASVLVIGVEVPTSVHVMPAVLTVTPYGRADLAAHTHRRAEGGRPPVHLGAGDGDVERDRHEARRQAGRDRRPQPGRHVVPGRRGELAAVGGVVVVVPARDVVEVGPGRLLRQPVEDRVHGAVTRRIPVGGGGDGEDGRPQRRGPARPADGGPVHVCRIRVHVVEGVVDHVAGAGVGVARDVGYLPAVPARGGTRRAATPCHRAQRPSGTTAWRRSWRSRLPQPLRRSAAGRSRCSRSVPAQVP